MTGQVIKRDLRAFPLHGTGPLESEAEALTRITQAQSTAPLDYASETPLTLPILGHLTSEPDV